MGQAQGGVTRLQLQQVKQVSEVQVTKALESELLQVLPLSRLTSPLT
jgi:hypothetical protein